MRRLIAGCVLGSGVLLLPACAAPAPISHSSAAPSSDGGLVGTTWVWDGPPGADYEPHWLAFESAEQAVVWGGCNILTFDLDDDPPGFRHSGGTEMSCAPQASRIDDDVVSRLESVEHIERAGASLVLRTPEGDDTYSQTERLPTAAPTDR